MTITRYIYSCALRIIYYNYPHVCASSPLVNSSSHSGAFNSRRSFGTLELFAIRDTGAITPRSLITGTQSRERDARLRRIFYNLLSYVARSHLFHRPTVMTNRRCAFCAHHCASQLRAALSPRTINLRPHAARAADEYILFKIGFGWARDTCAYVYIYICTNAYFM